MIVNEGDRVTAWITPTKLCSVKVTGMVLKKMMGWKSNGDIDYHPTLLLVKLDQLVEGDDEILMYDHCVVETSGA